MKRGASRAIPSATPDPPGFFDQVYACVSQIPPGRVATYGQVAALLGIPRGARAVGWALRALPPSLHETVPWQRVVGAGGRISLRGGSGPVVQRRRLRAEGVRFVAGRVDLERHGLFAETRPEGKARPVRRTRRPK